MIIKKQETEFLRKTKTYTIEINDKEVEVKKTWYIDDITNEYDVDYEIENEEDLTEDEIDEVNAFLGGAD